MRAVGDDEHADGVGGLLDLRAQLAPVSAASTPWSSAYTRTSACACGLTCPRTQPAIAQSGSSPGTSPSGDSATGRSTP